jgi:hypothetical protein
VDVCLSYDVEHVPVYVSDSAEQIPEQSATRVAPSLQTVMVSSPLQVAVEPLHAGKHDDHQDGGDGAASSAQVTLSRSCWHDAGRRIASKTPWHIEIV